MSLYKDFKDRVRRNSFFSFKKGKRFSISHPKPVSFQGVDSAGSAASLPPYSIPLPPSPATDRSPVIEHTPLPLPSPPPPSRPPRPTSLLLSNVIHLDTPTVMSVKSPRSPRVPVPLPAEDDATSCTQLCDGAHVTDTAWFIPVPILDRKIYPFEYQFGGTLGEGGFGKVMLALNIETRQECAIKVIAIRRLRSRREAGSVANEIKVLQRVSRTTHPFLARPAKRRDWYWQYRGNVHLLMEYYRGGDLGRNSEKYGELKNPHLFKLMVAEVILGILFLHDMGIIHHDVKPPNILVDARGHCVLTDYGGVCFIAAERKSDWLRDRTPIFTLRYAAPEVLTPSEQHEQSGARAYGPAIDFWSLGVTLFELATGEELIDDLDDNQAVYNIQHGLIDMCQLILLSPYPGLRAFVEALLVYDAASRLQGQRVKEHSYFNCFNDIDWSAIEQKERPPFRNDKQMGLNPRNTSYDYIERPGESILEDANEDIVERWFMEEGVGMPHHRQSEFHSTHQKNARVGLPTTNAQRLEQIRDTLTHEPRLM